MVMCTAFRESIVPRRLLTSLRIMLRTINEQRVRGTVMKSKKQNETSKPEIVEVDESAELKDKQLDQIAGGNRVETCDICGGPMRYYSPSFIMCLRCGREWKTS